MLRAFLPSALLQPQVPNAIQMNFSSSTDLHRVGDSNIVTTLPSIQPHGHHQARQQHHARGDAEHLEPPTPCTIRPTANGINANASVHINPSTAEPPITTAALSDGAPQWFC